MTDDRPLALGCMRLSTEPDRDETAAIVVLHAALDAGVTLLDTADAYCWTDDDRGHNERLVARALSTWHGDRSSIVVATKGGMTRPGGRWVPNGRAKHLAAAVEDSCRALGVERDRPLSASRARPACPAGDERPRPCRSEAPASRRRHRTLQRHRESDRGGEADRRDRLDPGGSEPLARSAVSEWRGSLLRRQSPAAPRVSAARRQEVTLARRGKSGAGRDRGAVRCDAVRRRTGMARRTVRAHRSPSWSDHNRHGPIDRAAPNAAADERTDSPPRRAVPARAPDQE